MPALSVKQAADLIGCSRSTVLAAINAGRLPATRQELPSGQFVYTIETAVAKRFAKEPRTDPRGWPRGLKRS